jgi:transposase
MKRLAALACGHEAHADINASRVIAGRATSKLADSVS